MTKTWLKNLLHTISTSVVWLMVYTFKTRKRTFSVIVHLQLILHILRSKLYRFFNNANIRITLILAIFQRDHLLDWSNLALAYLIIQTFLITNVSDMIHQAFEERFITVLHWNYRSFIIKLRTETYRICSFFELDDTCPCISHWRYRCGVVMQKTQPEHFNTVSRKPQKVLNVKSRPHMLALCNTLCN